MLELMDVQIVCFKAVIDADLIPVILKIMDQGDYKSQKEAVWVITNLTSGSNIEQVNMVVSISNF